MTDMIGQFAVWNIKNSYEQYRIALLAELGSLPSYLVRQKSSYDTLFLLEKGTSLFPDEIEMKVPEACFDLIEAGKALAFEIPTACGYHIFRATECVLRRYYSAVTGGQPHPKNRNIAVYVNAMRQRKCGDEKVLTSVEQMAKLHRNPLIHPEVVLTQDEAIATIGMARSVVTVMLTHLPVIPHTINNT